MRAAACHRFERRGVGRENRGNLSSARAHTLRAAEGRASWSQPWCGSVRTSSTRTQPRGAGRNYPGVPFKSQVPRRLRGRREELRKNAAASKPRSRSAISVIASTFPPRRLFNLPRRFLPRAIPRRSSRQRAASERYYSPGQKNIRSYSGSRDKYPRPRLSFPSPRTSPCT